MWSFSLWGQGSRVALVAVCSTRLRSRPLSHKHCGGMESGSPSRGCCSIPGQNVVVAENSLGYKRSTSLQATYCNHGSVSAVHIAQEMKSRTSTNKQPASGHDQHGEAPEVAISAADTNGLVLL